MTSCHFLEDKHAAPSQTQDNWILHRKELDLCRSWTWIWSKIHCSRHSHPQKRSNLTMLHGLKQKELTTRMTLQNTFNYLQDSIETLQINQCILQEYKSGLTSCTNWLYPVPLADFQRSQSADPIQTRQLKKGQK